MEAILAQLYPQNDWAGRQTRANYDVCAQAPMGDCLHILSHQACVAAKRNVGSQCEKKKKKKKKKKERERENRL